jgi:hypothetical protein
VSCAGRPSYKPEEARGKALNLRARRPCGGRVNRGGGLRAVAQGVFQAMRQQAMRGSRLRPPCLCLPPAHLRHRGTRANAGHRAPAGHAPMRTGGGRPGGAGGISRPFLGLAEILQMDPCEHKDHLFKLSTLVDLVQYSASCSSSLLEMSQKWSLSHIA